MTELTEPSVAELVTWAMCEMAGGGGKGVCDPDHCVCGVEGRYVARKLHEKGFRIHGEEMTGLEDR